MDVIEENSERTVAYIYRLECREALTDGQVADMISMLQTVIRHRCVKSSLIAIGACMIELRLSGYHIHARIGRCIELPPEWPEFVLQLVKSVVEQLLRNGRDPMGEDQQVVGQIGFETLTWTGMMHETRLEVDRICSTLGISPRQPLGVLVRLQESGWSDRPVGKLMPTPTSVAAGVVYHHTQSMHSLIPSQLMVAETAGCAVSTVRKYARIVERQLSGEIKKKGEF